MKNPDGSRTTRLTAWWKTMDKWQIYKPLYSHSFTQAFLHLPTSIVNDSLTKNVAKLAKLVSFDLKVTCILAYFSDHHSTIWQQLISTHFSKLLTIMLKEGKSERVSDWTRGFSIKSSFVSWSHSVHSCCRGPSCPLLSVCWACCWTAPTEGLLCTAKNKADTAVCVWLLVLSLNRNSDSLVQKNKTLKLFVKRENGCKIKMKDENKVIGASADFLGNSRWQTMIYTCIR